jgi:hypothetical protein
MLVRVPINCFLACKIASDLLDHDYVARNKRLLFSLLLRVRDMCMLGNFQQSLVNSPVPAYFSHMHVIICTPALPYVVYTCPIYGPRLMIQVQLLGCLSVHEHTCLAFASNNVYLVVVL